MATAKRLLSLLLLAISTPLLPARHTSPSLLSNNHELDNSISTSAGEPTGEDKPVDWVRISVSPPPNLYLAKGAHFELECEAVGSPAPIIRWMKDGKTLTEMDAYDTNLVDETAGRGLAKVRARLVIHALLEGNAGGYTCIAQSGAQVATAHNQLHVKSGRMQDLNLSSMSFVSTRSTPRIVLFDTVYMDHIGENVILPCSVVGNPLPEVFWLDPDENPITDDNHYSQLSNGALLVRNIRWNDMGPYTCVARNNHGQDNITSFLYPMLAEK